MRGRAVETDLSQQGGRTTDFSPAGAGYDALGFSFTVEAPQPRLAAYFDDLLRSLARPGPADHHYELRPLDPGGGQAHELRLDGTFLLGGHPAERLVGTLVHDINRRALENCELLTLHAGGVEGDGVALVLPGPTAAGKSTLVAGLVRAGFRYLTDEAVALERDTLAVRPYPKPLTLDRGSWPLFPELEPQADLATDGYKEAQWYVTPDAIRPGSVGRPCPIGVVVFPRFEAGAEPTLEPMGRAEAIVELAGSAFGFAEQGRDALDLLAGGGAPGGLPPPHDRRARPCRHTADERGRPGADRYTESRDARSTSRSARYPRSQTRRMTMGGAEGMTGGDPVASTAAIDRRTLIQRAVAAGAVAWTAPVVIDSLYSPAGAQQASP